MCLQTRNRQGVPATGGTSGTIFLEPWSPPFFKTPLCGVHRAPCPPRAGRTYLPLHPALWGVQQTPPCLAGPPPFIMPDASGGAYLPLHPTLRGFQRTPPYLEGSPTFIKTLLCGVHRAPCPPRAGGGTYLHLLHPALRGVQQTPPCLAGPPPFIKTPL